jgi:hypothetical protein
VSVGGFLVRLFRIGAGDFDEEELPAIERGADGAFVGGVDAAPLFSAIGVNREIGIARHG